MRKISEAQLTALWKNGMDLSRSWAAYATPDLKARWQTCQKRSAATAFADAVTTAVTGADAISEKGLERFTKALAPANALLRERAALQAEMQAAILGYLRNGHVFAYGFEPPRKLASVPVALPVSVWAGKIEWDQNRVTHAGLTFEQVRLTTRRIRNSVLQLDHVTATNKAPKVGRPGVAEEINSICRQMIAEGLIDPRRSQMSHYPAIRERLNRLFPDQMAALGELTDETLRRHFSPIFKGLKKSKKQ